MAWIRTTETQDSGRGGVDDKGGRHYERVFRVEFDSWSNDAIAAILRIPIQRFDPYVSPNGNFVDYMALADTAEAVRESEDSFFWIVTVPYSSRLWEEAIRGLQSGGTGNVGSAPPGSGPQGNNPDPQSLENPLNRPWRISHTTQKIRRRMYKDHSKPRKWVVNSAGDPFFMEEERSVVCITIVRNVAIPDIETQLKWEALLDTVNDATFLQRDAGTVKCERIDFTTEWENGYSYAQQTLEFLYKGPETLDDPDDDSIATWYHRLIDQGTNYVDAVTKESIAIREKNGAPATEPWALDGAGGILSSTEKDAGRFIQLTFIEFPQADFSILGLG